MIGTGVNGNGIDTCAARATRPAPPTTNNADTNQVGRGTTATRNVDATIELIDRPYAASG